MQYKLSTLAISVITTLTLAGCGDGGEESNSSPSNQTTIQVIDGYLEKALVCADKNSDDICQQEEQLGLTNSKGELAIDNRYFSYPLIATVISGQTKDADSVGLLSKTYSMSSAANQKTITPFTTLAQVKKISLDDLAAELNIDSNIITGDYVAAKNDPSSKNPAIKAHTIARSLAASLPETIAETNESILDTVVNTVNATITLHENSGTIQDLDSKKLVVTVAVDSNGAVTGTPELVEETLVNNLETLLAGTPKSWFNASLSSYWMQQEDIATVTFNKDAKTVTRTNNALNQSPINEIFSYSISGNKLKLTKGNNSEYDTFIFTSPNLSLSVSQSIGDLLFWTDQNLNDGFQPTDMSASMFAGKTWHYIGDDSLSDKPVPMNVTLEFASVSNGATSGDVTIVEKGQEDVITSWSIVDKNAQLWGNHKILEITLPGSSSLQLMQVTYNNGILLAWDHEVSRDNFSLLFKDKSAAEMIMSKWQATK